MEFDFSKLRGRIVEKFGTCAAFAAAMGFADSALSARMNNKTPWDTLEIYSACGLLSIPCEEIPVYFFVPKFEKTN